MLRNIVGQGQIKRSIAVRNLPVRHRWKRSREDDNDEQDEKKIKEDLEYDEEDYDGDDDAEEDVQDDWDDDSFTDDTHDSQCSTSSQLCRLNDVVLKYYGFHAWISCQYATREHRTNTNPNPNVV